MPLANILSPRTTDIWDQVIFSCGGLSYSPQVFSSIFGLFLPDTSGTTHRRPGVTSIIISDTANGLRGAKGTPTEPLLGTPALSFHIFRL